MLQNIFSSWEITHFICKLSTQLLNSLTWNRKQRMNMEGLGEVGSGERGPCPWEEPTEICTVVTQKSRIKGEKKHYNFKSIQFRFDYNTNFVLQNSENHFFSGFSSLSQLKKLIVLIQTILQDMKVSFLPKYCCPSDQEVFMGST